MPDNQFEPKRAAEVASTCACFNLRQATRAVTQLYDRVLRPSGLRATQFALLAALGTLGEVSVTRLAGELVMDRTTLTRNLRLLEERGLVRSRSAERDRRVRRAALTSKGRKAVRRAYPLWLRVQSQVTERLGRRRLERLVADLEATVEVTRPAD